mmetsp:Transcript_3255/g.9430  ORF Transcript_3255/g.9430 Transcript_3255/m.9430 type:complete len:206 (+) Transcript_3255:1834-2451(+)
MAWRPAALALKATGPAAAAAVLAVLAAEITTAAPVASGKTAAAAAAISREGVDLRIRDPGQRQLRKKRPPVALCRGCRPCGRPTRSAATPGCGRRLARRCPAHLRVTMPPMTASATGQKASAPQRWAAPLLSHPCSAAVLGMPLPVRPVTAASTAKQHTIGGGRPLAEGGSIQNLFCALPGIELRMASVRQSFCYVLFCQSHPSS